MTSRSADRWRHLDELLHRHAPRVAADLRPAPAPVTLGHVLTAPWCPPSVVESLEAHDGASSAGGVLSLLPTDDDTFWPATSRWLSIDEALAERAHLDRFFPDASTRWYPLARSHGRPLAPSAYEAGTVRLVVVDAPGEELLAVSYHWQDGPLGLLMRLGLSWSDYLDDLTRQLASDQLTTSLVDGAPRLTPR